jgi:hypothetical protein
MSAVLAIFAALAGFNAKQIRIGTVGAFAQRNANFGNGKPARRADREEVFAGSIVLAARQILVVLDKPEDSTTHENMRMSILICLDLPEAFIRPIDTIPAIDHYDVDTLILLKCDTLLRVRDKRLIQSNKLCKFSLRLQSRKISVILSVDPAILVQFYSFPEILYRSSQISFHCLGGCN